MAIRYVSAEEDRVRGLLRVTREIDREDGTVDLNVYEMPLTTLSIRAGEYDMDVDADQDALWDMILNEPFVASEESPLLTEPTVSAAREKHLAACRAMRDEHAARRPKSPKPVKDTQSTVVQTRMRGLAVKDRELVGLVAEMRERAIQQHRGAEAAPTPTVKDHVDNLKATLRQQADVQKGRGA